MEKFEESGEGTNIKRPVRHRFARSAENLAIVSKSVANDDFSSLLGFRTVLRHIMAYFTFRSTSTSI